MQVHRSASLLGIVCALLAAGSSSAQTTSVSAAPGARPATPVANRPPVIQCTLEPMQAVISDQEHPFRVRVSDPDGDRVTLRLLKRPRGLDFVPALGAASPLVRDVRWTVPSAQRPESMVFEAHDDVNPDVKVRLEVRVQIEHHPRLHVADVTGDGLDDAISLASSFSGAVYVWSGSDQPSGAPSATLTVPGAGPTDHLGEIQSDYTGVRVEDVTGDGVLDLVVGASQADIGEGGNRGAVYVWIGGPGLLASPGPDATLSVPGAGTQTYLASSNGPGIHFADVTGDAILDIVVGRAQPFDGTSGAVHVWAGGPTLSGPVVPLATLAVGSNGGLSGGGVGSSVLLDDVSGDGAADIVVGMRDAYVAGVNRTGAIHVWRGGGALVGTPAPDASLTVPGAVANDQLTESGMRLVDVTGDGIRDILAASQIVNHNGIADSGAMYMWAGGPGLSGDLGPTATLFDPDARTSDRMGMSGANLVADVTGDGILDVIATSPNGAVATGSGAIWVFAGGSGLSGAVGPTAKLVSNTMNDWLAAVERSVGVHFADMTGDSVLDIIGGAHGVTAHGVGEAGAAFVWKGGPTLTGLPAPHARLTVSTVRFGDNLGWKGESSVDDVTGDGLMDLVVDTPRRDDPPRTATGAVYVWAGGPALVGEQDPLATLTDPNAASGDGVDGPLKRWTCTVDVTGDAVADVVVAGLCFDAGGVADTGAARVWSGGPSLAGAVSPTASLSVPGAESNLQLGSTSRIQFADMTGDGVLDLIAGSWTKAVGGVPDAGAMYVWQGGGALTGALAPVTTLQLSGPTEGDFLGYISVIETIQTAPLRDWTGDGAADVFIIGSHVDMGGVINTGAIPFWEGPLTPGTPTPDVLLAVPSATANTRLGY